MAEYSYSTDEESYDGHHEDPFVAVAEAAAERFASGYYDPGDNTYIWIGTNTTVPPASEYAFPTAWGASSLLESMDDNASDNVLYKPERAPGFSDVSKEAREAFTRKLKAAIDQWALEYGLQQKWFVVDDVVEVDFTMADTEDQTIANAQAAYETALAKRKPAQVEIGAEVGP